MSARCINTWHFRHLWHEWPGYVIMGRTRLADDEEGMSMIDWRALAGNILAILGCALALAALSRASWLSAVYHQTFRIRLAQPATQVWLATAGTLFAGGEVILAGTLAARALWLVILGFFALQMVRGARGGQRMDG